MIERVRGNRGDDHARQALRGSGPLVIGWRDGDGAATDARHRHRRDGRGGERAARDRRWRSRRDRSHARLRQGQEPRSRAWRRGTPRLGLLADGARRRTARSHDRRAAALDARASDVAVERPRLLQSRADHAARADSRHARHGRSAAWRRPLRGRVVRQAVVDGPLVVAVRRPPRVVERRRRAGRRQRHAVVLRLEPRPRCAAAR